MDSTWLECIVSVGESSGEYCVRLQDIDGTSVSVVATAQNLWLENPPQPGKAVAGYMRVDIAADVEGSCLLARLPYPAMRHRMFLPVKKAPSRSLAGPSMLSLFS